LVTRLAKAYSAVGRDKDAVRVLEQALPAHPEDADAHLVAGRLQLQRGDTKGARSHFEQVKLQNPFNPEVHLAMAKLYEDEGKTQEAARARRFAELALKPRPSRVYELPAERTGSATLNIVAPGWNRVTLDGADLATPAWHIAVEPGTHTIAYTRPDGSKAENKVDVAAGPAKLVMLR
jgi:tetratricopeptide (TPR) repeat protein